MKHTTNKKGTGPKGKTVNYEGGEAFTHDDESTLLNLVSTCLMGEPKFYGDTGETEQKIMELANRVPDKYLLQLAQYARTELYLRSVPIYLTAIAAHNPGTKPFVHKYVPKVVQRADEIYELMAAYIKLYGKPIPNSLKKGLADCFTNFDEYAIGKYNRKTDVSFRDVIMLTHPAKPKRLLKKIMDDKLKIPVTWETQISAEGNKAAVWQKLIADKKLGYMATLRNLRNMLTTEEKGIDDKHLDMVLNYIRYVESVKKSRQFPFRFFSAYRELENISHPRTSDVLDALDEACYIAYENIPHMAGTTLIASDVSGSMNSPISRNSSVQQVDIGILMSSATHKWTDKAITGCFGDEFKTYSMTRKGAGILANIQKIQSKAQEVGWSTNGHKVIEYLIDNDQKVDRILIFTDMQLWDSENRMWGTDYVSFRKRYEQYKKGVNPDIRMYIFDLSGYGQFVTAEEDKSVVNIAGWSDKVFQLIKMTEEDDPKAQVKYIKESY